MSGDQRPDPGDRSVMQLTVERPIDCMTYGVYSNETHPRIVHSALFYPHSHLTSDRAEMSSYPPVLWERETSDDQDRSGIVICVKKVEGQKALCCAP